MVNNAFGYNTDPDLNTTVGAGDINIDENCAAANINNAIRTIMANIRDLLDDIGGANTSGGTATVQTLTTSGTLTALADGTILTWISGFDAGAGATLNVDTLGAKALLNNDGSAIAANDFALGQPMCAIYDASADSGSGAWLLINISQKQIDAINTSITTHESDTTNPHSVTAAQVGLGSVDNTADADKPVSTATQTALDAKLEYGFRNVLHNGGFQISQRGTSFTSTGSANNDDSYTADGAVLLSNGNNVVDVTVVSDSDFDSGKALTLDVETINLKFGVLFPIESAVAQQIIQNGTASLQFKAKTTGSSITAIRVALLTWSGTADAITSDVVSAWGAEDTNPTLVTNWTAENTAVDLTVGNTIASFTVENISVDTASAANLAVFIYTDETVTTLTDTLVLGDVQLEVGPVCTTYEHRPKAVDEALCHRYFWQGMLDGSGGGYLYSAASSTQMSAGFGGPGVRMRAAPTGSIVQAGTATNCSSEGLFPQLTGYGDPADFGRFTVRCSVTATGRYRLVNGIYSLSAEL